MCSSRCSRLVNRADMVAGVRAMTVVVKARSHREGWTSTANARGCSPGAKGLAFVTGGLAGAPVALLLAPQSDCELREQLRGYARRAEEHVHELADTATQAWT